MIVIVSSKGQMGFENAWLVMSILVVGMGLIFALQPLTELNDDIQAEADLSAQAKQVSQESAGNSPTIFDNVFFFLFIGLWIFLLIAAYNSAASPALMVVAIILGVVGLVVTLFVANIYEESTSDDSISTFASNFPKTNWILDNILLSMIFVTFSVMFALYVRNSG